jgi:hypothetical protein
VDSFALNFPFCPVISRITKEIKTCCPERRPKERLATESKSKDPDGASVCHADSGNFYEIGKDLRRRV